MIAKVLSEQKELDVNPEVIKQISFTANLEEAGYIFHSWRSKETILEFFQRTQRVLWINFAKPI